MIIAGTLRGRKNCVESSIAPDSKATRTHSCRRVKISFVPTFQGQFLSRMKQHRTPSVWLLAVLVIALASATGCSQSPEVKKQKAVERAEAYLKDGKANEAIIEVRNALQIDKDYVPALRALARAYATKAWYADAARELGRAQTLMPDSLEIAGELGRMQVEIGLWKEVAQQ